MKLSYFPQIKVVHTSKIFFGQLYVPLVNWTLMVGTVLIAAIYNNTTSLGNAYGVCVMFVTFFDTCMVTLCAIVVWRINPFYVFLPWLTIACLDGTFLSSALTKVPDGAWFTLTLAGVLASSFILWRYGKEQQWAAEASERFPTSHVVKKREDGTVFLTSKYGGERVDAIKGLGIFFDKAGEFTPKVFTHFVSKLAAAPEVMVFFHLRPLETPTIAPEKRYAVSRLGLPNCYRLVVRHGFMDQVVTPEMANMIYRQVRSYIIHDGVDQDRPDTVHDPNDGETGNNNNGDQTFHTPAATPAAEKAQQDADMTETYNEKGKEPASDKIRDDLEKLDSAFAHQVLYIVGKNSLKLKPDTKIARKFLLGAWLWLRENTRSKIQNFKLPPTHLMELGFVNDI